MDKTNDILAYIRSPHTQNAVLKPLLPNAARMSMSGDIVENNACQLRCTVILFMLLYAMCFFVSIKKKNNTFQL